MKKSIKSLAVIAASMFCVTCYVETGFMSNNINDTLNAMAISGELETGVQWNFDESTGILEFSGNGAVPDCNENFPVYGYSPEIDPPYYERQGEVMNIKISEGITAIGDYACAGTLGDAVSEVSLPDGLTSIGTKAFYFVKGDEKTAFKTVTIPSSVTYIGEKAIGWYSYYYEKDNAPYTAEKVIDGFVIKGYAGTVAEEYAKANGITFEDITGGEVNTEPATEPTTVPEVSTEEMAKNAIAAYKEAAAVLQKIPSLGVAGFSLYDMNNDGIPELIEKTGTCEADYIYNFITYRNGTIVNIGSDGAGHSALYKDNETGQLCKQYGQNGIGGIVWYTSDGYTVDMTESEQINFGSTDNADNAFATLGSFSRIDRSYNYKTTGGLEWSYVSGNDLIEGFDLSIFDRYDATSIPSDKNDEPAPVIPTETESASSEETTTISATTEKADTTAKIDKSENGTSSPKTGDKGITMTGTIGLLMGATIFIFRKKKR